MDRWPMANVITMHLGASSGPYPPLGVTVRRASPILGTHTAVAREPFGLAAPSVVDGSQGPSAEGIGSGLG